MYDSWWKQINNAQSIDEGHFQLFRVDGKPISGAIYSKRQQGPICRAPGSVEIAWPNTYKYSTDWVKVGRRKRKSKFVD